MTDTPDTDAVAFEPFAGQGGEVVDADFARELERQRNAVRDWLSHDVDRRSNP
jgi:hypothetical protein